MQHAHAADDADAFAEIDVRVAGRRKDNGPAIRGTCPSWG
jgi:hypothetical protein